MKIIKNIIIYFLVLSGCSGGDFGAGKHYKSAVVIGVGQCNDNLCISKVVKSNGEIDHWPVYDYSMPGMKVYRECWTEDDGSHCFMNANHNVRSMYKDGGER